MGSKAGMPGWTAVSSYVLNGRSHLTQVSAMRNFVVVLVVALAFDAPIRPYVGGLASTSRAEPRHASCDSGTYDCAVWGVDDVESTRFAPEASNFLLTSPYVAAM